MKILIKTHGGTYDILTNKKMHGHISSYWNILHYNIYTKLGHEVGFIGERDHPNVIKESTDEDILLYRGYNSFRQEKEFALNVLKKFKGRKILYLEGGDESNMGQYFDTVFIPEVECIYNKWIKKYPNKDIRLTAWTAPETELLDKNNTNPYSDEKYRIIYTGIFNTRMLNYLLKLADLGENIVLGGLYYDGKLIRKFTADEMNKYSKLHMIGDKGQFIFGEHFHYLKYADLAINFYAYAKGGALSSKLTEYLSCGLPVIAEASVPNHHRVIEYNAGTVVPWRNFDELYKAVLKEKETKRNRKEIMNKAREIHNPITISKEICVENYLKYIKGENND